MTIREIISQPMIGAYEVALMLNISKPTARKYLERIKKKNNYEFIENYSRIILPTDLVFKELRINRDFLEQNGGFDIELDKGELKNVN